jgi:hypothetical protein
MCYVSCPFIESCSLLGDLLFITDTFREVYKKQYCENPSKYKACKRFIVFSETGKQVPDYIMPNSQLSIEEILQKIE